MWTEYFDCIYVVNLADRFDRLWEIAKMLKEYEIQFTRFEAIKHEQGYFGLVQSMKKLYTECLERGENKILVFEDDAMFTEGKEYTDLVMNECVEWLSKNDWGSFHLGLQHIRPFKRFIAPHVLQVECGYSTHATAYNKEFMEYFLSQYIDEPIDNWAVREYQVFNKSFCAYPLLATQRTNYSDIYNTHQNWDMYIRDTWEKATRNLPK